MTQAVTELIVRGDGALAVLDRFEQGMENSGQAATRTTAAVASFEARLAKASAQIAANNAVTTQSIERRTAEQRVLERWQSRIDPLMNLEIKLRREAERAAVDYTNAVILGHTTQEAALRDLTRLEQSHATQLRAIVDGNQAVAVSAGVAAAANDNLAMATNRVAAANDNARFATANVAAQFQDVAVTAAMGMNPIMIALQQGTQLSSVLSTMKNPITGLATAFGSLFNPVSLLTIGFIALGAAAIQFFMGGKDDAEAARDALKEHADWLDNVLTGYDRAGEAADRYVESASKRPEGAVASDLGVRQAESMLAIEDALDRISDKERLVAADLANLRLGDGLFADLIASAAGLESLGVTASSTSAEVDTVLVRLTELAADTSVSQQVRGYASDFIALINQLVLARGEVGSLGAAMAALPRNIQIKLTMSQEFGSAMGGMDDLFVDPRSRFDQAREQLENQAEQATAMAQSYGDLVGVGEKYATVLESINAAEAAAAEKSASSAGKTDAEKMIGNYADLTRGAEQYIASKELEAETMVLAAEASAHMRHEQEMLNQAANDNIALSPIQREEIALLAEAMANADMVLAGAQMRMENRTPFEAMGAELARLDEMVRAGAISWEEYHQAATRSMAGAASDTLGSLGQITGALASAFEGNKALAVANAVVNTAEGITKALAQGGMFAFPIAAAIGIAGAAQIATILSASPGGGSGSAGAVRAPSAAPTMTNAPQRQSAERSPDRLDVTIQGLDRSAMYSGETVERLIQAIEERSGDGRMLKIKVAA